MKRVAVFTIIPLALGVGLGLSLRASDEKETPPVTIAKHPAPRDIGAFRPLNNKLPYEFDILVPLRSSSPGLAVAINVQDQDNYYLVELSGELTVTKVENGLSLPLTAARVTAGLPSSCDVVIKRRRRDLVVAVNGKILAAAYDGSFRRGAAAISTLDALDIRGVKVQAVGDIYFADDFMKGAETGSQWEEISGSWHINTLNNSGMSSNAFFYTGRADNDRSALSTAGYWFWDNYAFEASCKAEGSKYVGLCFYYRDPKNYFLFRWGADKAGGRKQLVKVSDGRMTVLAEEPGGYSAGQWYAMEVRVNRRMAKAFIDGSLIFAASDDGLAYGKVGLYNEGPSAARFDDVFVRNDRSFFDSFSSRSTGSWRRLGGEWEVCPSDPRKPHGEQVLRAGVTRTAKIVTGNDHCRNYTFTATAIHWRHGDVGLVARYLDEANHYLYTASADGRQQLIRYSRGVRTVLAETKQLVDLDRPHELFLSVDNNILTAGIDGEVRFEEWDETIKAGRAGLYASRVRTVDFDNVCLAIKRRSESVLTTNELFEHEKTMESWASELRDWFATKEVAHGKNYSVSWHRADFPGGVEISARLGPMPPEEGEIRLAICADKQSLGFGYGMTVRNKRGLALELFRMGRAVAKQTVQAEAPIRVSLQRKGAFVIGLVNFEPVIKFEDKTPLEGIKAAIAQTGRLEVAKENVQVYCPGVQQYTFSRAASEWRAATGTWQVTSRWECDNRWSFFSGVSKNDAILWCKRLLKGDVSLEFAAGIKMNRAKGNRYEYASDINATICADGEDLTSGYSFMFGGWGNTCTRILRGNTVVAESTTRVIPNKQNIHRRWFYIKLRKRGRKLQYWIDNQLVLEFNDPNPLKGNRLALWTHKNGIMVAKVRISCDDAEQKESPDFRPGKVPRSPYTTHPEPGAGGSRKQNQSSRISIDREDRLR